MLFVLFFKRIVLCSIVNKILIIILFKMVKFPFLTLLKNSHERHPIKKIEYKIFKLYETNNNSALLYLFSHYKSF